MQLNLMQQLGSGGGKRLPRTGLIWYAPASNGFADSIELSASDYLSIRPELRSIFFSDADTKRSDEDIITNIEASPYLNDGVELVGNTTKGYALYVTDTEMLKAYKYFGFTSRPVHPPYTGLLSNYRSSSIALSDGALISAVPDYYQASMDAVQATEANRPIFVTNAVGNKPAIQLREAQILNLPAAFTVHSRSMSVFFISRNNHQGANEKIYAAIGGSTKWMYKTKPSPNSARIGLYSSGDTISAHPLTSNIQLHGIGSNATKRKYWANENTSEIATLVINEQLTGGTIAGGYTSGYWPSMDMFECLIYDHLLTDGEYAELLAYADAAYGINYAGKTKQVIFHGNSLMAGKSIIGNGTIANRFAAVAPPNVLVYNLGQDSMTTAQISAAVATNINNLYNATLAKNIAVIWELRNDLAAGVTKEDALAHLITLCQGLKNVGFQVVVGTALPSAGMSGTYEADRAYIRGEMLSSFISSGYADVIADVGNDSTIGEQYDYQNTTYYADQVHLTSAGAAIAAGYFIDAINSIL